MQATENNDHPLRLQRKGGRVQVLFEGHLIADSDDVLVLNEADLAPVFYFPRQHVEMEKLVQNDIVTHCPYKGDARHFTVLRDGVMIERFAWSYDRPNAEASGIGDRIAFYPEHVDFHEIAAAPGEQRVVGADADPRVDEVIQHTDSGSGASQKDHWEQNVSEPEDDDTPDAPDAPPYRGVGSI
ncbi:DUF427 domain-containing protein [Caulobacter segnis]|uniref:DUF427 domain-containing protein n=1 Tax=Caulobacter segnis TaxID=88688 RepID=UPI00240FDAE8|nr:DUF427 domain-containing protein [Caulobacter segnis]MDG2520120.1 DUF427 domain-containing protein [Caulobacter segnis]